MLVDADVTLAAASPPARAGPAAATRLGPVVRTGAGWLAVLAAWELAARTWLDGKHLVAAPSAMVQAARDNAGLYWRALQTTLAEAAWGFLWGNLAAVLLAALVAVVPASERTLLRIGLVVYCLPLVAIGPLLRVIFGIASSGPQVTLAALAVFYTTLVPLLVGLRAVPSSWAELVASYGRGRFTTLMVVRARASVPYLAAGLQVAVPAAFLGALVGEFTGAERGVGILTIDALRSLDTDGLWALAGISALVSVAGYALAGALAQRLSAGRPPLLLTARHTPATRRRSPVRVLITAAEVVGAALIVVALWSWSLRFFDLNPFFAKSPTAVWEWMVSGPEAAEHRDEIFGALGETARVAIPGCLAGLALGAVLAALFDLAPAVRRTMTPFVVALRCVPIVSIAPLLVRALGRGDGGMVVTVALMTFFPALVAACTHGLRQTPGQVLEFYEVYNVNRLRTLVSAQVPAMLPAFFAAARIAVPSALLASTVAEWLATGTGMGNLMALSAGNNVWGTLWSSVVVLTAVASVAYAIVTMIESAVLKRVAPEQRSW